MPSPIAHSISGYVIAKLLPLESAKSSQAKKWGGKIWYSVFVANAPDLDFIPQIVTGVAYHRGLTHSLIFMLGFSAIAAAIASYVWKISYRQILWFTLILYGSHLLLDFFTEGRGIQFFAPLSNAFFRSPVYIFPGTHYSRGLWHYSHLLPIGFELIYSALLLWGWRQLTRGRRSGVQRRRES